MFEATEAAGKDGESYLRDTDTEYKILNDIASRLGENTQATGTIKLFTELDTCYSCSGVIADFATKYKNIKLEIIHNDGNRIIPQTLIFLEVGSINEKLIAYDDITIIEYNDNTMKIKTVNWRDDILS